MSNRLTKITTRTGDDGKTNLGTKDRLSKCHIRIETLGTLDELNSSIGLVLAYEPGDASITKVLKQVQQDLFDAGGELCPPYHHAITVEKIAYLDTLISKWNATLPPLTEFILPGGNLISASCHMARTICRRAERCMVALHEREGVNPDMLRYLNRLSDLLFIVSRILARETNSTEELWEHVGIK
jgi:cob(I)alamin adenosyltransferase